MTTPERSFKSKLHNMLTPRADAAEPPKDDVPVSEVPPATAENRDLARFIESAWSATSGHEVLAAWAPDPTDSPPEPLGFGLDLGTDFVASVMTFVDEELAKHRPEAVRNLGYSLLGSKTSEQIGFLVLGKAASWRRLWTLAADSFLRCETSNLARYASGDALRAFTETAQPQARDILDLLGEEDAPFGHYSDADLHDVGFYAAYYGDRTVFDRVRTELEQRPELSEDLRQRWENLVREFASQLEVGDPLGASSYPEIRSKLVWDGTDHEATAARDDITLGFLNYRCPTRASSNIGDHVQTIGALGQLRSFDLLNLDADPAVRSILDRNPTEEQIAVEAPVRIIPVDRDFSILQGHESTIWVPVCGWFAHPVYKLNVGLPFASNINPIFMSFHVNNFDILTPETFDYLKAHEPIGCRDYLTVRTLREQGISAFFNGCVTLTLGDLYLTPDDDERHGRYYGAYNDKRTPDGYEAVPHLDRDVWTKTFDENIAVADELLQRYQHAEDVTTPLLHCLLPCRSMGTPVTFTNPKEGDPRFQGLVDADDEMREATADRFRVKYKAVMTAILQGHSKEEVYDVWREVCAPDIERTDELLAAEKVPDPLAPPFDMADTVDQVMKSQYNIGAVDATASDVVNLLFAFDYGYLDHFLAVMHGLLENTTRPIRAHLFVRDLPRQRLEGALAQFENLECRIYDLSFVTYGDINLMSHISVSTMDRLMAPEIVADIDRLVYLDIDILVRGDIGELFDLEFGDLPLAGRSGVDRRWSEGRLFAYEIPKKMAAADAREFRSRLFDTGPTDFKNFNAGVLWMNLEALRAERMSYETIGWSTRFGLNDQYALNLFARRNRGELPASWNHFSIQEFHDDPNLVHYVGPIKPWSDGAVLPFVNEWKDNATAVAGWNK